MANSESLVEHSQRGNDLSSSSHSLHYSVSGVTCMSEVLQQDEDLALANAKCEEGLRCRGSYHSAFVGLRDKQVNSEVDFLTCDSKIEKPVRKKKTKNEKKTNSSKKILNKIVSEKIQSNYGGDAKLSCQSSKEEIESPAMDCEKCLEKNTPLVNSTSLCASNMEEFSQNPDIHSSNTRTCCRGSNNKKQGHEEVSSNCSIEDSCDSLSFRNLLQSKSCASMKIMPCRSEVHKIRHAVKEINGFKSNNLASQLNAANKIRHQSYILKGKENSHLGRQKTQRTVKAAKTYGTNRSHCNYVDKDVSLSNTNSFVKHNSFLSKGLLPAPLLTSFGGINGSYGIKNVEHKESKTNGRIQNKVLVESSRWTAQQRSIGSLDQYVSRSSGLATCQSNDCNELKLRSDQSFKPWNNCRNKEGLECNREYLLRPYNKSCICRKESLEDPFGLNYCNNSDVAQRTYSGQHITTQGAYYLHSSTASAAYGQPTLPCSTKFTRPVQGGLHFYGWMKMPGMNHVLGRSFCPSTVSKPYKRFKQFEEHAFRKDVTSGMNLKKSVCVGTKELRTTGNTGSASISNVSNCDLPFLHKGVTDSNLEEIIVQHCESSMLSKLKGTSLNARQKMNSVKSEISKSATVSIITEVENVESAEVTMAYVQRLKDVRQQKDGPKTFTEALGAAYKMQLVSESIDLVTGCTLAEFERFLHSASPVIATSSAYEKCAVCLGDQVSSSYLCKHQTPNISLCTVWKWYEEPGNYGLKVNVGDSQNSNGLLTNLTSFHAYFVPFLSAIQLFGYHLSNSHATSEDPSKPEMQDISSLDPLEEKHLFPEDSVVNFDSTEEPSTSCKVFTCDGGHMQSFISSPVCSSNCELVFEFFETEQPQMRKPLHSRIVDLIDAETSRSQLFGDPSKLESSLHDLHPASWFSVAWYPIYRIPDGKFCASFLTYHSLGHLVQRHVPADSPKERTCGAISPVVGMESYNAKGECWFDLRIPVESYLKELSPFTCSEILKEHLGILEENASLFARGCVYKDGIKVLNRHPDYEFFSSRKQ